jgi:hypothetical protein
VSMFMLSFIDPSISVSMFMLSFMNDNINMDNEIEGQ